MTFKSIEKALRDYPVPRVSTSVVDRAILMSLRGKVKVWPLLLGTLLGISVFGVTFHQVILDYLNGIVPMASYVSLPLTVALTALMTLFKLMLVYGDWLMASSMLFVGVELASNRKWILSS